MGSRSKGDSMGRSSFVSTQQMVAWVRSDSREEESTCLLLLGTWVAMVRYSMLVRAEKNHDIVRLVRSGGGRVIFDSALVPQGLDPESFWRHLTQATGMSENKTQDLLHYVHKRLVGIGQHDRTFQPVGRIELLPSGKMAINLLPSFLQPEMNEELAMLETDFMDEDDAERELYDMEDEEGHTEYTPRQQATKFKRL